MKKYLGLLLISIIFSCENPKLFEELSDEKLVDILYDIHVSNTLLDATSETKKDSMRHQYFTQMVHIHQIDSVLLDSIIHNIHLDIDRYYILSDSLESRIKREIKETK